MDFKGKKIRVSLFWHKDIDRSPWLKDENRNWPHAQKACDSAKYDLLVGTKGGALFWELYAVQTDIEGLILLCLIFALFAADEQEKHNNDLEVFSVSPPNGILEARKGDQPTKDVLQITFTARYG